MSVLSLSELGPHAPAHTTRSKGGERTIHVEAASEALPVPQHDSVAQELEELIEGRRGLNYVQQTGPISNAWHRTNIPHRTLPPTVPCFVVLPMNRDEDEDEDLMCAYRWRTFRSPWSGPP